MRFRNAIINITFVSLLLFISTHAIGFGVDVKAGANVAYMYGENAPDGASIRVLPVLAAGFGVKMGSFFTVQSELLLSSKGYNSDSDLYRKLSYFEIALPLLKLNIPGKSMSLNFYTGPALGLLYKAKELGDVSSTGIGVADDEVDHDYKTIDFGAVFGAGAEFKVGRGRIIIDARYTLGLINVMEPEIVEISPTENVEIPRTAKNGAISLMLGYGFDFGG